MQMRVFAGYLCSLVDASYVKRCILNGRGPDAVALLPYHRANSLSRNVRMVGRAVFCRAIYVASIGSLRNLIVSMISVDLFGQ